MNQTSNEHKQEVVAYYENTGLDYGEWSKEFNMHFGYYKWGMNPFNRESMLEEMNKQVFKFLDLRNDDRLVYDFGCGLAAPCRSFARQFPDKTVKGITIVPWQIDMANGINDKYGLKDKIELIQADYTNLPLENNSADGVYALESSCHCEGLSKEAVIKEMLRVLKPGKRFVIVDGFIKSNPEHFSSLLKYCYNEICKGWALPSFPQIELMKEALEKQGASAIEIKDFSFRVAPSVLHSPLIVVYFALKKMMIGEKLNKVRIGHLKACFLGLILGIHRHRFSYCLVTGVKSGTS